MSSPAENKGRSQSTFEVSLDVATQETGHTSKESSNAGKRTSQGGKSSGGSQTAREACSSDECKKDSTNGRTSGSPKPHKDATPESYKPKRVRTGCLTCRKRHLKCDEAVPRCQNCQKSGRVCARGLRLNFIDTQTVAPPHNVPRPPGTQLAFQDESREIASEYIGGFERYPPLKEESMMDKDTGSRFDFTDVLNAPPLNRQNGAMSPSLLPTFPEASQAEIEEPIFQDATYSNSVSNFTNNEISHSPFPSKALQPPSNTRPFLNNAEEVLLMQVFVEEVGLWMDSMDANKHFTHILPYHALDEPMLLNAFMACGARHLSLVNSSYSEERAIHYYNAASRDLLVCLQNPHRDTVLCATTAVILNVYEVMCESPMQRMNHIAGARALIKECRWNGRTPGIGGACFWLNVGMELLSCLHFNWQMAWDPDTWDVDMNMTIPSAGGVTGDEELWTHRIVYICAKIANLRATVPKFQGLDRNAHEMRINQRCHEWNTFKQWCEEWAKNAPRSMMPLGYLQTWQTNSKSSFPEVWLIKRSAVVARLFYHTACLLLAKIHPIESEFSPEMRSMQQSHAHDICGIVAHVKDRGVASVSIRCLAIAAECLSTREAQEEVLEMFDKISKETGWRIGFLRIELHEKWGWNTASQQLSQKNPSGDSSLGGSVLNTSLPPVPPRPRIPSGIVNPMMATADFSMENHPYHSHYVAPLNPLDDYQFNSY